LTSTLDGNEWSASRPGHSTPQEIAPDTHWIGGWVGPRSGVDTKSSQLLLGLKTSIFQPVDQRYTKNNFGISTKRKGEGTNNIHEYDGETNYDTQMFKILNWFITL